MMGTIMIVRISEAGRTPTCCVGPEKIGRKPNTPWSQGSRFAFSHGPKTRIPHSPSTTLGIAASNSTTVAIGALSRFGAISVRNSAIAIESGVARSSAMNEVTTVPKMKDAAPKSSEFGFQAFVQMNPRPEWRIAGQACATTL